MLYLYVTKLRKLNCKIPFSKLQSVLIVLNEIGPYCEKLILWKLEHSITSWYSKSTSGQICEIITNKYLYANVHISRTAIYANKPSDYKWQNVENLVYSYNLLLFTFQVQWNSDTWYNTDWSWGRYAKWNKPDTKGQIFHDSPYMRYWDSQIQGQKG